PGSLKNVIDWLSRALDLSNPKGPSILENKFTTVSAAATGGQEQMFAHFADLLPFVRTQMVGDFTAVAINPEAWATG
ncbi:NAD(P)H-dependent oxidoreductase, partial [Streptococcus pyogenes]